MSNGIIKQRMANLKRYGKWSGNPGGRLEDLTRCTEEVWPTTGWIPYQCQKKRGHGENGEYCKQHAKRHPEKQVGEGVQA
jgi:hypothetical protein